MMNAIQYICFCLDRIAEMAMAGKSGVEISEEIRRLKKTLVGEEKVIVNGTIETEEAEAAERLQPNVPAAIQNMSREQAADYVQNKCRDCDKQIYCSGNDAKKCNDNVSYLLEKYGH